MRRKNLIWPALALAVLLSFALTFLVFHGHKVGKEKYLTQIEGSKEKEKQPEAAINENTEIITKVIYEQSGQEEVTKIKPTNDMIGLTKKDLEQVYNGWIIDEFSPSKVHLTLRVAKQAEGSGIPKYYLGIKDGFVAVYKQPPGSKPVLKQLTKIPVKSLPLQEAKDLEKGIQVKSEEELLEILEGLSSSGEY